MSEDTIIIKRSDLEKLLRSWEHSAKRKLSLDSKKLIFSITESYAESHSIKKGVSKWEKSQHLLILKS